TNAALVERRGPTADVPCASCRGGAHRAHLAAKRRGRRVQLYLQPCRDHRQPAGSRSGVSNDSNGDQSAALPTGLSDRGYSPAVLAAAARSNVAATIK